MRALIMFPVLALASGLITRPATAQHSPAAGRLTLRNGGQAAVRVEVRAATDSVCARGAPLGVHTVQPGRTWVIRSSQPVCLGREGRDAQGRAAWQGWERKNARAAREEVVL